MNCVNDSIIKFRIINFPAQYLKRETLNSMQNFNNTFMKLFYTLESNFVSYVKENDVLKEFGKQSSRNNSWA
jgi:hypothetical protein